MSNQNSNKTKSIKWYDLNVNETRDFPSPRRTQQPMIVHAHTYIITLSEKLNPSIFMSNWPNKMIRAKILHFEAMATIAGMTKKQRENKCVSRLNAVST